MDKMIIPAIIAKNQNELEERINKVEKFFKLIQIDIMDGNFVPNHSIDFDFKLPKTKCKSEAHLMVSDPLKWIKNNYYKVDMVLAHFESLKKPQEVIDLAKKKDKKIGFVLNPETDIDKIQNYLDQLDQVLIMTVNPGFYGSSFLPEMLDKISRLRKLKPDLNIEVDGGINDKTLGLVDKAGANMFVSGSYIVKSDNVEKALESLEKIIKK